MFSGTTKYLMDANAIRALSVATISDKHSNDRIIATIPEVKQEVFSLSRKLSNIQLESLNVDAYRKMKEILSNKSTRKVIDYYYNRGAADVALLAHALTTPSAGVFIDEIVIITNDVNLRSACDDLGVIWKSIDDFKLL